MTKNSNSLDQRTFKKLRRSYLIALSIIAFAVIVSHIIIEQYINTQLVGKYTLEGENKINGLRQLEWLLMVLLLIVLLIDFLLIFWSAAKTVKSNFSDLMDAEKKAKKMAYDADILSEAKKKF